MKDPAILFYSKDFLVGCADLTMEERGQFMTLYCLQHQKGRLTPKTIQIAFGFAWDKFSEDLRARFAVDDQGLIYLEELEEEIRRRALFAQKQQANGRKGGRPKSQPKPHENPDTDTDDNPDSSSDGSPTETTDGNPARNPGGNPEDNSVAYPKENPIAKPDHSSDNNPNKYLRANPNTNPARNPGGNPEDNSVAYPKENPIANPDHSPHNNPNKYLRANPNTNPARNPGGNLKDNSIAYPIAKPDHSSDNNPKENPKETSRAATATGIGSTTGDDKSDKGASKKKEITHDFIDPPYRDLVREWLDYKKARGEGFKTEMGIKLMYAKLLKLSRGNPQRARQIIDESMANNWAGLFPLKNDTYGDPKPILAKAVPQSADGYHTTIHIPRTRQS